MKYAIQQNMVIYVMAGRNEFKINVARGKVWVTREDDLRDLILAGGDSITLKNSGKVAVQAFDDSHLLIEGSRFTLHELVQNNRQMQINRIKIGQTNRPFRPKLLDGILTVPSWKHHPVTAV